MESERDRIGRELHDGLAQSLLGIALQATTAYRSLGDDDELRAALEKIHSLAREGLAEARVMALGLTAPAVRSLGVVGALQLLAHKMTATSRLRCQFVDHTDGAEFSEEVGHVLYRFAQEAIQNAVRHGGAGHVRLLLERDSAQTRLHVLDDGSGLPSSGLSREPVVPASLVTRLRPVDGHCAALCGPLGRGTWLIARIPVSGS